MDQETHRNFNEYFPLWGKLGAPGGSAKLVAMVASVALAVATVLLVQLAIVCTPHSLLPTSARVEVQISGWDFEEDILWELKETQPQSPALDSGSLQQAITQLALSSLVPDTDYTLWFYTEAGGEPVGSYHFRTPSDEPLSPPTTLPASTGPAVTTAPTTTGAPTTVPTTTGAPTTVPTTLPVTTAPTTLPVTVPTTVPPTQPPITVPSTSPPATQSASTGPAWQVPAPMGGQITDYTPLDYDTGSAGSYTVQFTFALHDGLPTGAAIQGEMSVLPDLEMMYGEYDPEGSESMSIGTSLGPEDITVDPAAGTATVTYTLPYAYRGYRLTATLHYRTPDGERGSVTSEEFRVLPTYLHGAEMDSQNRFDYRPVGDQLQVILYLGDFRPGTMEFRLHSLDVWVSYDDGETYALEELITKPPLPQVQNGSLSYTFTIPMADPAGSGPADAVFLSMDAEGECYLEGQPMQLATRTYGYGTLLLGTTYTLQAPAVQLSQSLRATLESCGLALDAVHLYASTSGTHSQTLLESLPGDTIYVELWFRGTVTQGFTLTPQLTLAPDLTDAYWDSLTCYPEDWDPILYFSFTMPERNVTAEDIILSFLLELL